MTIRLYGNEALKEAYCADRNVDRLINAKFAVDDRGESRPLDPFQAIELVKGRRIDPAALYCEVPSVWEHLISGGFGGGTFEILSAPHTVLLLTRDHGYPLSEGVRGLAAKSSLFEKAGGWAKGAPLAEPDRDWHSFVSRLEPLLPLRKNAWRQNEDLGAHAREIAALLIDRFALDPSLIRENLLAKGVVTYVPGLPTYGGALLDAVLDQLRSRHVSSEGGLNPDPIHFVAESSSWMGASRGGSTPKGSGTPGVTLASSSFSRSFLKNIDQK